MKTSEKIGIVIIVVLATILATTFFVKNSNESNRKEVCDQLCQPSGPKTWFLIGLPMDENNNFTTKDECINACLP